MAITINKCCIEGEIFDVSLNCVKIPDNHQSRELDWFPESSIVNMTTFKIHKSHQKEYLQMLKKSTIKMGSRPNCSYPEIDSTSFREIKPLFHFLLFPNWDMKFYVRSWKSWHHPSHVHNFTIIEEDDDEEDKHVENNAWKMKVDQAKLRTFPLEDVCVDAVLDNINLFAALFCPCKTAVCIRKCCLDGYHFNGTIEECFPIKDSPRDVKKWRPNAIEMGNEETINSVTPDLIATLKESHDSDLHAMSRSVSIEVHINLTVLD